MAIWLWLPFYWRGEVLKIPVTTGTIEILADLYPGIDVMQELKELQRYLVQHKMPVTGLRETSNVILTWLKDAQESRSVAGAAEPPHLIRARRSQTPRE